MKYVASLIFAAALLVLTGCGDGKGRVEEPKNPAPPPAGPKGAGAAAGAGGKTGGAERPPNLPPPPPVSP
jgi:hypothetical protein